jgi:putative nucleotidyltransferase with HDIG domain
VLVSVAAMIDAKSPYTRAHSERVGIYSRHFGQKLGISSRELKIVTTGGRLHDIGKIGTPDQIIDKPERLTPEEWKIVQHHPVCGAELLKPIAMMRPYIPVVRWHHENHDGTRRSQRGIIRQARCTGECFAGFVRLVQQLQQVRTRGPILAVESGFAYARY